MSDPDSPETTSGGLVGAVVGKAKSAVGSLLRNDDLKREGNLQQAQAEAEVDAAKESEAAELRREEAALVQQRADAEAESDRLRTEIDAEDRRERIEESAAERAQEIARSTDDKQAAIEQHEALQHRAANTTEGAALHRRAAQATEVARLEREAQNAEARADAIDPEAN